MTSVELKDAIREFRHEWTFNDAIDAELPAQAYYEYCRESMTLRTLAAELGPFLSSAQSKPSKRPLPNADLFPRIDRYTRFAGLFFDPSDFPQRAWSELPSQDRGLYKQRYSSRAQRSFERAGLQAAACNVAVTPWDTERYFAAQFILADTLADWLKQARESGEGWLPGSLDDLFNAWLSKGRRINADSDETLFYIPPDRIPEVENSYALGLFKIDLSRDAKELAGEISKAITAMQNQRGVAPKKTRKGKQSLINRTHDRLNLTASKAALHQLFAKRILNWLDMHSVELTRTLAPEGVKIFSLPYTGRSEMQNARRDAEKVFTGFFDLPVSDMR